MKKDYFKQLRLRVLLWRLLWLRFKVCYVSPLRPAWFRVFCQSPKGRRLETVLAYWLARIFLKEGTGGVRLELSPWLVSPSIGERALNSKKSVYMVVGLFPPLTEEQSKRLAI